MQHKIVITRPAKQSLKLVSLLEQQGKHSVIFSMFEIAALSEFSALDQQLQRLHEFALVVFVSPNAVDAFFARLQMLGLSRPETLNLAVMGEASRATLKRYGVDFERTKVISPTDKLKTDSETLLKELDLAALAGREVLVVRGDSGRDFFASSLRNEGVQVTQVASYRRVIPDFDQERQHEFQVLLENATAWVVTSSEVLPRLLSWAEQLGGKSMVAKMQQQALFVPHARISEKAEELGFQSITLTASGDENLALALQSRYE